MISKGNMRKAKKRTEVTLGNVADSDNSLDEETTTTQSKKHMRDINTDEESEIRQKLSPKMNKAKKANLMSDVSDISDSDYSLDEEMSDVADSDYRLDAEMSDVAVSDYSSDEEKSKEQSKTQMRDSESDDEEIMEKKSKIDKGVSDVIESVSNVTDSVSDDTDKRNGKNKSTGNIDSVNKDERLENDNIMNRKKKGEIGYILRNKQITDEKLIRDKNIPGLYIKQMQKKVPKAGSKNERKYDHFHSCFYVELLFCTLMII